MKGVDERLSEAGVSSNRRKLLTSLFALEGIEPSQKIPKRKESRTSPLSYAQQRLWFLDQIAPNNPYCNISGILRLDGRLDLPILESVLNEIVRRHEILRTRFDVEEGMPVQVVEQWVRQKLEMEDLSTLSPTAKANKIVEIIRIEREVGFDLRWGPLLRVKALRLDKERHLLIYTTHHIISDGWSMGILSAEVGKLYQAYCERKQSPLPELPIQYADFAVWQREQLAGAGLEAHLAYWRKQLAGMEVLELPADHLRPMELTFRGALHRFVLGKKLAERLRQLSRKTGTTLFMTLLAGFDVAMSRYSRLTDIALATDITNRNRVEVEGLIGIFVNQLVLRAEVRGREKFIDFLARVREVCLAAYAHQDAPFEKVVEDLQPERDLNRAPLCQVKLILQNSPVNTLEMDGLRLSDGGDEFDANSHNPTAKLDLTVDITDQGDDLVGVAEYSRDLFEPQTIERLLNHYINLLSEVAEENEKPVADLRMLADAEREQILTQWNQTTRPFPQERRIHQLFAEQAELSPDRIALTAENHHLSYRELNRRTNQLGRYLKEIGVGPETLVGVLLERSTMMMEAVLGTLKAGGAYLPLDPEYPIERLGFMLEDAAVGVLLTRRHLEGKSPAFLGQTVCLDVEDEKIRGQFDGELRSAVEGGNLAYVIYTSGSTGRPKGVMIAHHGVCNLSEAQKVVLGIGEQTRALQFASLSFDASVWEIFSVLTSGGSLILNEHKGWLLGDELARVLRDNQITMVTLPPSILATLGQEPLSGLQTLVVAGEACPSELVERWASGRKFFDAYGPTEATVCASVGECGAILDRRPSIGRPLANTQLYILDRDLHLLPIGAPGELYISGVGLARGYLGRPDLTAERFLPDRFSVIGGERIYHTGDLCRYLPNGTIDFIGRADDQVKLRGYRIELGEIQAILDEQPLVKQSVVVIREGPNGVEQLFGYVTGEEGLKGKSLKRKLEERLPGFMTPDVIMVLKELPRTANGKIDKKKLPAEGRDNYLGQEYVPPRTPIEEQLVGLFEDVLNLGRVGVCDNFFEIGGHSILATQIVSRVRDIFGVQIEVRTIFDESTVERFSRKIEEALRSRIEVESKENGKLRLHEFGILGEAEKTDQAAVRASDDADIYKSFKNVEQKFVIISEP